MLYGLGCNEWSISRRDESPLCYQYGVGRIVVKDMVFREVGEYEE
ncbi:MAG: hypothetical protein ACPKPY_00110 [Nitrososphaeraceae archaeon]